MAQVSVSGSNPGVQPSTSECPQGPVWESSSHELKHMSQHLEQRLKTILPQYGLGESQSPQRLWQKL